MKKVFPGFVFLMLIFLKTTTAQILDPVKWSFTVNKLNDCEAELVLKAKIDGNWHLYGQKSYGDEGPVPTSFNFVKNSGYEAVGKPSEKNLIKKFEPVWNIELNFFEHEAVFKQKIKVKSDKPFEIKGSLEYMVCNDVTCLPPTPVDFTFKIEKDLLCTKPSEAAVTQALTDTSAKAQNLPSQMVNPVKWNFSANKLSDGNIELVLKADLEGDWHMYGQKTYGDDGPRPTSFVFIKNPNYDTVGKTTESKLVKKFEPIWNVELDFFEHEAVFKQIIKVKSDTAFVVKGSLEYMVCNETSCMPPTPVEFSINIGKDLLGSNGEGDSARSWWSIFIVGFLGGLAALLTPCVFPMIPMTVSFFTKRSKNRAKGITNAIIYGSAIIVIYVLLGLGVTMIFGSDALNALSTNVWFNLAFFLLLVVFAISFLGAFEIVLPSSFINKVDAKSDKGGLIGIFFMAFTLSLVSFSCTGPIIGTLLVDAAVNGGIKGPFWGMFGFSAALALPFGLFAAFPGWLNSLPKSGGWLNSVKVVLGFLELALALKFASNADLVVQAGIITREVFITIWIVIFALTGIYLMGWIKFSHDSDVKFLSVPRLFFAILVFSFTVYLIPGLWGAPLKLISGFPPPDFYSESPQGFGGSKNAISVNANSTEGVDHKKEHCPNDLPCFHNYDEALAYAKKVNKPLMLDFTGWACVNCRKMESQVWPDPEVDRRLRNDVVLVSLYVDDKNELPADQQTVKKLGDRDFKIKTIGNKWSYMQADRYKTNTQPQYILIDNNEQMLTSETSHYDPDIKKYVNWLDEGIAEFKKRSK
jgi:thiol:disulfide interchange protein